MKVETAFVDFVHRTRRSYSKPNVSKWRLHAFSVCTFKVKSEQFLSACSEKILLEVERWGKRNDAETLNFQSFYLCSTSAFHAKRNRGLVDILASIWIWILWVSGHTSANENINKNHPAFLALFLFYTRVFGGKCRLQHVEKLNFLVFSFWTNAKTFWPCFFFDLVCVSYETHFLFLVFLQMHFL